MPEARRAWVVDLSPGEPGTRAEMERIHADGFFEAVFPDRPARFGYRLAVEDHDGHGWDFVDADDSGWALWRELLSFDTRIGAEPGTHLLEFSQQEGIDPRELDVRIWFEGVSIATAEGGEVPLAEFIAGGARWWKAHDACDPRTMLPDVAPPM